MSASDGSSPSPRGAPPLWPDHLREAQAVLRSSQGQGVRQTALEKVWLLLQSALLRYLTLHSARLGGADREDLEDLASEKSLDLVARIESGAWDLAGRDGGAIAGFVSTVARNGLIDWLRKKGRLVSMDDADTPIGTRVPAYQVGTENRLERKAFAGSLSACIRELNRRDRTIWFFRVFYDLPSREIAAHPEVGLKSSHVDVILQRCRDSVRECMSGKGYTPADMPPGTFAELWAQHRLSRAPDGETVRKPDRPPETRRPS